MKRSIFCFVAILSIALPCMAEENTRQFEFDPFELFCGRGIVSGSFGLTSENTTVNTAGLGFSLIFFTDIGGGGAGGYYIEPGLLVEYNFHKLMEIRPFAHFGVGGISLFSGIMGYLGFSGVYIIGDEINTFGIAPEIGIEGCLAFIWLKGQLQYDFYLDSKYNHFRYAFSASVLLPLGLD